ncbi:Vps52 / Sac2 family protein [Tieghemostelium lacteum]|uniref:Vps52 / Sac2 family protein n=1 Tax=Tieghemostelium lacteum TaxID=361077 RepID=A0A151ZGN8_TIELA|nr:Vps52 / Sac2 family protein [Tieghemostelium lacteum]|eukprot:KYQ93141.1 Vps52 / Sac2 family protein [Tieghemostelium lacteum]
MNTLNSFKNSLGDSDDEDDKSSRENIDSILKNLDQYAVKEDFSDTESYNSEDEDKDLNYLTPSYIIYDQLDFKDYQHIKKPNGSTYQSIEEMINYLINDQHVLEENNQFSSHIESELKSLPSTVLHTYFEQSTELLKLHNVIKDSKKELIGIGSEFEGFIGELSDLIKDMPDNHLVSMQISKSLKNRTVTRDEFAKLIESIVIPPELIQELMQDDVDEDYIKSINELTQRVKNLDCYMQTQAKFIEDMAVEIDLLKKKACRSVRDFLLKLIISLRKPRTNVQILQHSKLFKYSTLNQFLYLNKTSYSVEVKNMYIDTVSKIFNNYFRSYLNNLTKVFYQISFKMDVIGYFEVVKGYFSTSSPQTKSVDKQSAFNLNVTNLPNDIWTSIRSESVQIPDSISPNILRRSHILQRCLDAPLIIPHAALKNNKKYPFEQIFRSMNILLLDTVSSEYLFTRQWFPKSLVDSGAGFINPIFDKVFQQFFDNIGSFVGGTWDCLGVLLSIKLNEIFTQVLQERRLNLPSLTQYFHKVDVMLWDKFSELFKRNIDSLKLALTKEPMPTDTRPHIYTRRFSEFYASISEILSHQQDPRVSAWMAVLRSSIERVLVHFSSAFPDPKSKSMFLLNNYDVVTVVLSENNLPQDEETYLRFQQLTQEQMTAFVELHLYHYYKDLIEFIKDTEFRLNNTANYQINKDQLSLLTREFSLKWKETLHKIQVDIMSNFTNFNLGSNITKQIISQFLIYYKRFEEIFKKSLKQQSSSPNNSNNNNNDRTNFIPISTITYEISKSYNSF